MNLKHKVHHCLQLKGYTAFVILLLLTTVRPFCFSQENSITIDFSKKGASVSPSMYGVFFEEINHAGDGGLYAEMIQNRGFEDKNVPANCKIVNGQLVPPIQPSYLTGKINHFSLPWDTTNKWPGWNIKTYGKAKVSAQLTTENPLNEGSPHSLELTITNAQPKEQVELINEGFWGIAVKKQERYQLRFYLRAEKDYSGNVIAKIRNPDDELDCKQELAVKADGAWHEYTSTLQSKKTDTKARFVLGFTGKGKVWVDYVSLFPEKTFKNRKNGLRQDVAQAIADLKPAFVRWPGGCNVEGLTLEDRVKWKETLGDPATRPGAFDLWGYCNSYGFGYHEYLQFCEDIGASAMFVCNAGLSCAYRNGDYCTDEELPLFIRDALDAIEYALGDTTTAWGRKRAENGHPSPFPLKYVEVGNENYGPVYARRFNVFYKAIKEKYPQITVISSLEFNHDVSLLTQTDLIDSYYYKNPAWFFAHTSLFDTLAHQPPFKIYVGAFACNQGVGNGTMEAALSEAAFMTGMEHNSDLVTMCSYAPLIENSNNRNWPVNLIWLNNHQVFGRSSYYVQKLFAENRPTVNLSTLLQSSGNDLPSPSFKGLVGLGTSQAQSVFSDFEIKETNRTTYKADWVNNPNDWEPAAGHWRVEGENYIQGDLERVRRSFLQNKVFDYYTIEVKARENKGSDGFCLIFGAEDYNNYYQLHIGADSGQYVYIEKIEGGIPSKVTTPVPFALKENQWYQVKATIHADEVECFINNQSVLKYTIRKQQNRFAIAGYDEQTNEIVLKVVNAEPVPFQTSIKLDNMGEIDPKGRVITLAAKNKNEENSFKDPTRITPQPKEFNGFSTHFSMEFKPWSLTVLRVKRK